MESMKISRLIPESFSIAFFTILSLGHYWKGSPKSIIRISELIGYSMIIPNFQKTSGHIRSDANTLAPRSVVPKQSEPSSMISLSRFQPTVVFCLEHYASGGGSCGVTSFYGSRSGIYQEGNNVVSYELCSLTLSFSALGIKKAPGSLSSN
jgi:hypothetical protein